MGLSIISLVSGPFNPIPTGVEFDHKFSAEFGSTIFKGSTVLCRSTTVHRPTGKVLLA